MALSVSTQVSPIATKLVRQTSATATADCDVLDTSGSVYMIDVDNAANAAASYLKLYDSASPTVGTTAPDFVWGVPAGVRRAMVVPEGIAFAVAISMACVTAGGTSGTTPPSHPVVVMLACQ
jgi:hypothetical protein